MKKQNLFITASIFLSLINACKPTELLTITVLEESEIGEITSNSAVAKGNVLEIGESMQAYGHVWGESENPTISNFKSEHNVKETGFFFDTLLNLSPSTTYYLRPYAKDRNELIYENSLTFTTLALPELAILSTNTVSEINYTTAASGGNVTDEGSSSVTSKGVCWSVSTNPTIADEKTNDGNGNGTFTSNITGLTDNTSYYVRAYATSDDGTSYGEQQVFNTLEYLTPTVGTSLITNIDYNTASGGGSVTSEGSSAVIARGLCWSTSEDPTIQDIKTINGTGTGPFSSNLTNLIDNTMYYVRAYSTNAYGTGYGQQESFTTLKILPTVTTTDISSIAYNTATSGGEVTIDGYSAVIQKGVCWSTTQNPTISDNITNDGIGVGTFTSDMINLSDGETYYVKAYATNGEGTTYGEEKTFTTIAFNGTVTDYDGNIYNAVQIGNQIWMAENLKTSHYSDGTELVDGTGVGNIMYDYTTKYMFDYEGNSINTITYGKLYTWAAVMNGENSSNGNPGTTQGICPVGWHVSSKNEWLELADFLGGESIAGGKLKEIGTIHWVSPNIGANNESGFTALPSGARNRTNETFYNLYYRTYFWTSTWNTTNSTVPEAFWLFAGIQSLNLGGEFPSEAYSVRCIKD